MATGYRPEVRYLVGSDAADGGAEFVVGRLLAQRARRTGAP
jgi:hypothetical protein